MKKIFPTIDKYLSSEDVVISSSPKSKDYVNIPELMMAHGPGLVGTLKMRLPIIGRMVGCLREAHKSASSIKRNPNCGKTQISSSELAQLEEFIYKQGIDMIGYTSVPQELIFNNHKILYGNAIVFTMEMHREQMQTAPSKRALKEVFRSYYGLGVAVNAIADYMRSLGFNAMAAPAIGGDVSYVPLAERAGMGAIGRHGLLITERSYGVSFRLAAIYTDIENLPFAAPERNPHLWIKDFCAKCGKCVRQCPSGAIYDAVLPNGRAIDQTKCAQPFAHNYGCSLCIKNCTFFDGDNYKKLKNQFVK